MTVMTLMTVICRGFLDGGGGYVFHRRWISSIVQSLQSGTCSTGIGVITAVTIVTTFGGGLGLWWWGYTCVSFCACGVSQEGYCFILVTEVTAVMKTIICSETLRLPTGPQLRAFSQTGCRDRSGGVPFRYSRPTVGSGRGGLRVHQMWPKSGGVPAVLGGAMISLWIGRWTS
jgi:hypothetical protein